LKQRALTLGLRQLESKRHPHQIRMDRFMRAQSEEIRNRPAWRPAKRGKDITSRKQDAAFDIRAIDRQVPASPRPDVPSLHLEELVVPPQSGDEPQEDSIL
jgi:hypothetical protein